MTTHTKTGRGGVWRQPERRLDPAAGDDMVVMVAEAAMVVMVAVAVGVAGRARDGGRAEMDDLLGGDYCRGRDTTADGNEGHSPPQRQALLGSAEAPRARRHGIRRRGLKGTLENLRLKDARCETLAEENDRKRDAEREPRQETLRREIITGRQSNASQQTHAA